MATDPNNVGEILDGLQELAERNDSVTVDNVMDAFGARTFGPAIMIPALLELTPIGAIPGVPTFLAVTIVLIAVQKAIGREHVWLPGAILNRSVASGKIQSGVEKLRPVARFMDRHFHGRLKWIARKPFSRIAAGIVVLLCLTVPFLEVLPFASSVPMLAIAAFGLAVLVRDGALMILALAGSLVALSLSLDYWDGGMSDTPETDGVVSEENVQAAEATAEKAEMTAKDTAEKAADAVNGD
ncbi:exopolysaccharide biosynthesis protein [Aurantiacibacter aquimixticola]|uniref:Exopolysaccharide biosynthesis protein n=1 Tax=Aurantiacibacter aquimixticola TaxID=1958945 RepID=A0A419RV12_9SPHN|nr:exopolysaccharide biosynthesis protein [Aurantiacibacter aquimixticola]RJY09626.1 exopolysaccharide biosynthesis protein [Aurantiacibacter aquimixticola]